ncbi:MAG TPA: FliH/SctL family protein [Terriglobales bacterium]|nr:FliH/SctL family protein [Terriglobales bacterium]
MKSSLSEDGLRAQITPFVYRDSAAPRAEPEPAPAPGLSEDEAQARAEQARRDAWSEAEQALGAELERRLRLERDGVLAALREFVAQRELYFQQLEREVVQLVLGIARKVLQREAQLDPLLLAGTVRVALDQLAAGTQIALHVPPSQLAAWQGLLTRELGPKLAPDLLADPALEPAGCRLETASGASDLSLTAQLQAVEQGFFDLLQRREQLAAAAASA